MKHITKQCNVLKLIFRIDIDTIILYFLKNLAFSLKNDGKNFVT